MEPADHPQAGGDEGLALVRPTDILAYKAAIKAERERAEKVRSMLWPSLAMVKANDRKRKSVDLGDLSRINGRKRL